MERKNLQALSITKQSSVGSAIDHSMLQNLNAEDQLAQKIADLDELEAQESEDANMEDSDQEDMKRIIEYSDDDENGESENDEDQPMSDDGIDEFSDSEMGEEGENEQSESGSDSEEDEKLLPKKRTLKDRLKEEKDIRK